MAPPTDLLQIAHALYGRGLFDKALELLPRMPKAERTGTEYRLLYGACLARTRRVDEAIGVFLELLNEDPNCYEALTWMASLRRGPGELEEAMLYARRAIELRPEDAVGHGALGTCALSARQAEHAIEAFQRASELAPDVAEHRHNLALAYLMSHRHGEAIVQLRRAMALAPYRPHSYLKLASTYALYGMAGQAIECLTEGLAHMPESAALHSAMGGAFAMVRNDEAAERHHRRALELSPESRSGFAAWLLNQGRFDEANTTFRQMIEQGSDPAFAYYGLMQSQKLSDDSLAREMESLLEQGSLRPAGEMYLHYGLGRAHEQIKQYQAAIEHFDAANRLAYSIYHAGHPIVAESFREEHIGVQRLYESLRERSPAGDPEPTPIFIIGMIRSGTTLLDQIVSSHPSVASGGELRFWIEETLRLVVQSTVPTDQELRSLSHEYMEYARLLAGSEPYITDKMPLNFAYAGVMHLAMPNARFLHIRRHPIDTCLSIYTTYFGQGALFAYDRRNIVEYYRAYLEAMDYWRSVLPADRLLELDYEDLVADPARVVPQVIEFCGLPWDDACLRHDQNQSAINTPSRWQARQPIYRTSLERWRNYEPWLEEFAELAP